MTKKVYNHLGEQLLRKRTIVMLLMGLAITSLLYEWFDSRGLAICGLIFLVYYMTDIFTKFLFNKLPRQLIENINDKAVLITGCDSGFGQNLAIKLDSMGFKVYAGCLTINGDGAQHLRNICSKRLILVPLDVTKNEEISAATQLVLSTLEDRKLWAVVNNAGIACSSEIEWCPVETFQRMLDVNTTGAVRVTKAFLPQLRESRGRVVIVASLAGRLTLPGFTPYSMSKFAVVAFADGLRREMKKWGVSVHLIEPSLYKTNIAVLEPLFHSLTNFWNQCGDEVLYDYGPEYLDEFKVTLQEHMNRARPKEKINEVVNDMVDSVAGAEPQLRYVPALDVQFRSRMLMALPIEVQDHLLNEYSPKTPPTAMISKRKKPSPYMKITREILP